MSSDQHSKPNSRKTMNLSQMTLGTRLYAGFGLILAVMAIVTVVAVYEVQAINTALRANSEEHVAIQRFAINFRGSAHDRAIAVRDVVLSCLPGDRQKEVAAIDDAGQVLRRLGRAAGKADRHRRRLGRTGRLYGAIKDIEGRAVGTTKAIIAAVDKGDTATAQKLLWTQAKPQYVQWLASINKLIDYEEARVQAQNTLAIDAGRQLP
jgi:methyl-accepting chemotaxis protein